MEGLSAGCFFACEFPGACYFLGVHGRQGLGVSTCWFGQPCYYTLAFHFSVLPVASLMAVSLCLSLLYPSLSPSLHPFLPFFFWRRSHVAQGSFRLFMQPGMTLSFGSSCLYLPRGVTGVTGFHLPCFRGMRESSRVEAKTMVFALLQHWLGRI